jgi:hypothetical protein
MRVSCRGGRLCIHQVVCIFWDIDIDLFDNTLETSIIYDRTGETVSTVNGTQGRKPYIAAEIKPQRKTPSIESTSESTAAILSLRGPDIISVYSPFVGELPFTIDDTKSDVLIRRSRTEVQKNSFIVPWFFDNLVRRCFRLVNEIWVEYIELHKSAL